MPKGKKRRAHDASAPASASPEAAMAERVLFEDVVGWLEREVDHREEGRDIST